MTPFLFLEPRLWALGCALAHLALFPKAGLRVVRPAASSPASFDGINVGESIVFASEYIPVLPSETGWHLTFQEAARRKLKLQGSFSKEHPGHWRKEVVQSYGLSVGEHMKVDIHSDASVDEHLTYHPLSLFITESEKPGMLRRLDRSLSQLSLMLSAGSFEAIESSPWPIQAFFGLPYDETGEHGALPEPFIRLIEQAAKDKTPDAWASRLVEQGLLRLRAGAQIMRHVEHKGYRTSILDAELLRSEHGVGLLALGADSLSYFVHAARASGAACFIVKSTFMTLGRHWVFPLVKDREAFVAGALGEVVHENQDGMVECRGNLEDVVDRITAYFTSLN